uniref:Uncharacterized protein n=1 Tax=Fagus sylvatica TaxID=28930 RepID=A0A2N9IT04_FAGSY
MAHPHLCVREIMARMVRSRRVAHPPPLSPFSFPFVQYCPKLAEPPHPSFVPVMFRWQWVWGLLPFQVFIGYPLGMGSWLQVFCRTGHLQQLLLL